MPNIKRVPNSNDYQIKDNHGDNGVVVARDGNGNIFVCNDSKYNFCDICTRTDCLFKKEPVVN